ncbi:MAG: ATP phosphoribosyltransferase [Flavobacteriales bacterium]|nr:ATP phosphoribosyltransferase [Flavobacteriales bacterium]
MEQKLRIAIQKSGRLSEKSLELLKECAIGFNSSYLQLKAQSSEFPAELLYLRDDDIPGYVEKGIADIGIVGLNVVEEHEVDIEIIERLGFAKCKLCIAVPKEVDFKGPQDLNGQTIATSYPVILGKYLKEQNISADIHLINGSVEIAPAINLAQAIFDIVSTGSTLMSNGLKKVEDVTSSEAVLIGGKNMPADKKAILNQLMIRIRAVLAAKGKKYVLMNVPTDKIEEIKQLLPGEKSPTIMNLAQEGWSSLHTVVEETKFWDILEQLKGAGAENILVSPIEKIIL